jgi:hypothetical protein
MESAVPTLLRVQEPLSLYFRPGRNDHTSLRHLLASGPPAFTGAVLEASLDKRHDDLRAELRRETFEAVLDPMTLELATLGGHERPAVRGLSWAGPNPHTPSTPFGSVVNAIAEFAVERNFDAVLAPTHYITGADDPWWRKDHESTHQLRRCLDDAGRRDISIYYRLAMPRRVLLQPEQCRSIVAKLAELEIDAVWLSLHPVGADSSAAILKSCLDAGKALRSIGVPIVMERAGYLGVALMGFNAAGGLASGITSGDNFDAGRLLRPARKRDDAKHFAPAPRVYLEQLGIFLERKEAKAFLEHRGMRRQFACRERCCAIPEDTFRDPRRHLLHARAREVAALSRIPAHHRPSVLLDGMRRASDKATVAAQVDKRFEKHQRRLGEWRLALADVLEKRDYETSVITKSGGRYRRRKSA